MILAFVFITSVHYSEWRWSRNKNSKGNKMASRAYSAPDERVDVNGDRAEVRIRRGVKWHLVLTLLQMKE